MPSGFKEIKGSDEVHRLMGFMRKIENLTNSDGEHDSDYSAVCDRVNEIARQALYGKD